MSSIWIVSLLIGFVGVYIALTGMFPSHREEEIHWNWDSLLQGHKWKKFPKDFLWGSATAAHQVEGNCTNNNWHAWEQSKFSDGTPHIKHSQKSGATCDHWNLYKEDVKLMKEIGLNTYRFSIEWSKIEPQQGHYDISVVKHYHDLINELLDKKIEPMITLFHFTTPLWFEKLGGFENEANVDLFVDFSKKMYLEYGKKVTFWCTLNEPEVFGGMGYLVGIFPPGKHNLLAVGEILKNVYASHVKIYNAIKKLPGGETSKIGFAKNIVVYDPYNQYSVTDRFLTWFFDKAWNGVSEQFFLTGEFNFFGLKKMSMPEAPKTLDYIGLNYYTHFAVKAIQTSGFVNQVRKESPRTDMDYGICAEGFYRALKRIEKHKVPIYITENGVADVNDTFRSTWIERHMYVVQKCMDEGMDIRGFYYWSLMDNFEWAEGYEMRFGLFEVDFKTQKRTLRNGSKTFLAIAQGTHK